MLIAGIYPVYLRFMPAAADGKEQIAAQVTVEEGAYILRRAEGLDWRRGKFLSAIIRYWFEQGCPAVHKADTVLPGRPSRAKSHATREGPDMNSVRRSAEPSRSASPSSAE